MADTIFLRYNWDSGIPGTVTNTGMAVSTSQSTSPPNSITGTTNNDQGVIYTATDAPNDQRISTKVLWSGTAVLANLIVRAQGTAISADRYFVSIGNSGSTTSAGFHIGKIVGGTLTWLLPAATAGPFFASTALTTGVWYEISLGVIGSFLYVMVQALSGANTNLYLQADGTWGPTVGYCMSITDTALTTGRPGVGVYVASGTANTVYFDDTTIWSVTAVPAQAIPVGGLTANQSLLLSQVASDTSTVRTLLTATPTALFASDLGATDSMVQAATGNVSATAATTSAALYLQSLESYMLTQQGYTSQRAGYIDRINTALPNAAPSASGGLPLKSDLPVAPDNTTITNINTRVQAALPNAAPGATGGLPRVSDLPVAPDNATIGTINTTTQAIAGYVDTEVAAIKAKTDNLPADTAGQLTAIKINTDKFTNVPQADLEIDVASGAGRIKLDATVSPPQLKVYGPDKTTVLRVFNLTEISGANGYQERTY